MTKTNETKTCSVCGVLPTEEAIYHTRRDGWICGHCMDYRSRKAADTIKALEDKVKALEAKNLEEATWASKEIAIMDRKHSEMHAQRNEYRAKLERAQMMLDQAAEGDTEQRDKVEGLWAKLEDALEALKTISTMIEYFAPARMAAGKGMAFFEEIEAKAGKAAGLPGY